MRLIRPEPLPDELANGYQGRFLSLNGLRHDREALAGVADWVQREIGSSIDLSPVEVLAWMAGQSSERFVQDHTTLPFRRSVISDASDLPHGSPQRRPLLLKRALCDTRAYACFCSQCVEEDVRFHGHSYWRRSHQLPGIYWCSKHDQALHYVTQENPFSRFPATWLEESCEQFCPEWVSALLSSKYIQRYASICNDLLMSDKPVNTFSVQRALRAVAVTRGIPKPVEVHSQDLYNYVQAKADEKWLRRVLTKDDLHADDGTVSLGLSVPSLAAIFAALFDSADEAVNAILQSEQRFPKRDKSSPVFEASVLREAYMAAKGNHVTVAAMLGVTRKCIATQLKPLGLPPIGTQDHGKALAVIALVVRGEVSLEQACRQHALDLDYMRKRIETALTPLTEVLAELQANPVEKTGRWPVGQRTGARVEALRSSMLNPRKRREVSVVGRV